MSMQETIKKLGAGLVNLVLKTLKSRLFKFIFIIAVWIASLKILCVMSLLNGVDSNLLIVVNIAMFFFALTASPSTWIIKGPLGFETGSNDPKHTHITLNENSHSGQIDIREYGDKTNIADCLIKIAKALKEEK